MKKLIGLLIVILSLSLNLKAQEVVIIPDTIAALVIDDLIQLDGLRYELHKKDSIIVVYEERLDSKDKIILVQELAAVEYEKIIANLEKTNKTLVEDKKQLERERKKEKWNNILNKVVIIGEAALIVVLATLLII